MHAHGRTPSARGGYTLLELMIVLAILVSVMAVAWPSIARRIKLIGPREAALQVKADLAEAREQAIHSGEAWALRIERGGVNYEFGPIRIFRDGVLQRSLTQSGTATATMAASPWNGAQARQPIASDTTIAETDTPMVADPRNLRTKTLPPGIVFDAGFAHSVSHANAVQPPSPTKVSTINSEIRPATTQTANAQWKFAVIFQPSGQATESEIRLMERATENTIRLRVRRFTGGVSIDPVERKPKTAVQPVEGEFLQAGGEPFSQSESASPLPQGISTNGAPTQVAPQSLEQR